MLGRGFFDINVLKWNYIFWAARLLPCQHKYSSALCSKSVASVNVVLGSSMLHYSISEFWTEDIKEKSVFLEWNAMAEFLCGPNASGEGHRAKHCGNWSSPAVPEPRLIGNYLDCMLASGDQRSLFGYLTVSPFASLKSKVSQFWDQFLRVFSFNLWSWKGKWTEAQQNNLY